MKKIIFCLLMITNTIFSMEHPSVVIAVVEENKYHEPRTPQTPEPNQSCCNSSTKVKVAVISAISSIITALVTALIVTSKDCK